MDCKYQCKYFLNTVLNVQNFYIKMYFDSMFILDLFGSLSGSGLGPSPNRVEGVRSVTCGDVGGWGALVGVLQPCLQGGGAVSLGSGS